MNINETQLRELIVTAATEIVERSVRTAQTRVLPATVFDRAAQGSPIVRVIVDGDDTPIAAQNTTAVALSPGARVLVLFFPPHGAVVLGAGAPVGGGISSPAAAWNWSYGPLAYHSTYAFDFALFCHAVTLTDGSIVVVGQESGSTAWVRLKPPYTSWFAMWDSPYDVGEHGEIQVVGDNVAIIGGDSLGAGGQLYHGSFDIGASGMTGNGGPGAGARDPSGPFDVSVALASAAWDSCLGGWQEAFLFYFASAVDRPRGRVWQVGPRNSTNNNLPGNFCGFLDVPDGDSATAVTAVPWIMTADLPAGAGAVVDIEAHSACCDSQGNLYVGGGLDTTVVENRFRRYVPGPPVVGGISEVQRFQETDPPGWPAAYQIALAHLAASAGITITEGDNAATIQTAFDTYLGAGIVTIAGTDADFTATWTAPGMQERFVIVSNGAGNLVTITVPTHGDGYPSTDTWTELAVIPGPFCFRGSMAVDLSDRVYYASGLDGSLNRLSSFYRYTPDVGWDTLSPIPGGYVTVTTYGATSGESQPGILVGASLYFLVYAPDDSLTRLAVFNTVTETWTLSPPCATNHQRGGFTYADGKFWVIAGGDPVLSTKTAIVESIPAL